MAIDRPRSGRHFSARHLMHSQDVGNTPCCSFVPVDAVRGLWACPFSNCLRPIEGTVVKRTLFPERGYQLIARSMQHTNRLHEIFKTKVPSHDVLRKLSRTDAKIG